MNLSFQHLLPEHFSPASKVWVFQSNRIFSIAEALELEPMLHDFVSQWLAHGAEVKGYANLFFGQFIVVMADEDNTIVSGCSTDGLFNFIKKLEQEFKVTFTDRQLLAFVVKDKLQLLPYSQLQFAWDNGFITSDTLFFDNLVSNKKALTESWIKPVGSSWLMKRIKPV